ncbi:MAG: N-acetylmuramoyl-L-alanine amidase [Bacteroidota bacterium]
MYKVKFYKGDYDQRQYQANADGAVAYVEQHFNSSESASPDYSVVIVGSNASNTSRNWGRWYAAAVAKEFNTQAKGDNGIVVGGYNGRGDDNLKLTKMPAVLLEPLFASNYLQAGIIRSDSGQNRLARVLVDSIKRFFPDGGLIAFSVGHKYKTSSPNDPGAALYGGGFEAEYAEKVLVKAEQLLTAITSIETDRTIRMFKNDILVYTQTIDSDANVTWDGTRGILRIIE